MFEGRGQALLESTGKYCNAGEDTPANGLGVQGSKPGVRRASAALGRCKKVLGEDRNMLSTSVASSMKNVRAVIHKRLRTVDVRGFPGWHATMVGGQGDVVRD